MYPNPQLDKKCVRLLEPVSSHVMLIKIYFVVRPLKKGLNSCWCSFKFPFFCTKCPFWLTSEVGPIFQIKLWYLSPTFQFSDKIKNLGYHFFHFLMVYVETKIFHY